MQLRTLSLFFFFIFIPIHFGFAESTKTQDIVTNSAITPVDELIDKGHKQLKQIAIALSSVSFFIGDKSASIMTKRSCALEHITALNTLIQTLRNERFAEVDLPTAYSLLKFTKSISKHILHTLQTHFAHIESFDMEQFIQKSIPSDTESVDVHTVIDLLNENEIRIRSLTRRADTFGIKWHNRLYRTVDDWVIAPGKKHQIPQRALISSALTFLGFYGWGKLSPETFNTQAPSVVKKLFGQFPQYSKTGQVLNYDQLGIINRVDHTIGEMLNNWSPIGKYTITFLSAALIYEWKHIKPVVQKKIEEWTNRLRGGSYLREAQKAAEHVDKVNFKDIFGQEEIIRCFQLIVDYLKNPEPFDRLGITPPKGILCVGNSRTGKTYAVTALLNEITDMLKSEGKSGKFKFFNLDAAKINLYGFKLLMADIKRSAPCIVFIDEIDLLDLQRTGKNETLSECLTCMSGIVNSKDSKNQIIIIAATNRPENLDHALRQPGRFGKELRFEYPNVTDRRNFIAHKLEKLSIDLSQFDLDSLAQVTHNKSYEALKMLIDNALLKSRIQGEPLTQKHIEQTLEEDIYHIIPNNSKIIPEHESKILAAHFAGQALALTLLNAHSKLSRVTIKQVMTDIKEEMMGMHLWNNKDQQDQKRFEYGKIFIHHDHDSINMQSKDEKIKMCKFYLAGFAAEEILLGACSYSCHAADDKKNAFNIAQSIILEGMELDKMPDLIKEKKFNEISALIHQMATEVTELLSANKETLEKIATLLEEKKTINSDELQATLCTQTAI